VLLVLTVGLELSKFYSKDNDKSVPDRVRFP